jgi:hypothetical protein
VKEGKREERRTGKKRAQEQDGAEERSTSSINVTDRVL